MGMISDFFVASDKDARAYGALALDPETRRKRFNPAEWKGLLDLNVSMLWAVILNEPFDADRHELMHIAIDGETWLFRFPDSLVTTLASLSDGDSKSAASKWAQTEELQRDGWEAADAERVVLDLRRLAGEAQTSHLGVYLWGSL